MLRSRLFWKLFLGFTFVNLLTAAALVAATWAWQKDEVTQIKQAELRAAAAHFAKPASDWLANPSDEAVETLRELTRKSGVELRLLRNSDRELLRITPDNRPPQNVPRISSRLKIGPPDDPLGDPDEPLGEITVERPATEVQATLRGLWKRYAFYAPLVALAMVVVGYLVVSHLVGPVQNLNRAAIAMAGGRYDERAFVANRDELGALARSFNEMSAELGARLSELEESDHRQATVLGGMVEGVVAVDGRQRVLFANSAAGRLFDFTPPEVVRRPLLEVVRHHALHQAVGATINSARPQRLEISWDDRVLSVQVTPLRGDPGGAVVVLHDTTELRRLENLRRDFVANVSHELKTPLSTIRANAETLLRGAVDDKEHRTKFLVGIEEQSERLGELIRDMLHLARIESAQQPFDIANVAVADAVASCLLEHGPRAEAKQIDLTSAGENGSADAKVKADRNGLQVILNNLVDNAIKYTPDGGSVRVLWEQTATEHGPMVRIEVLDSGIGIPEEKLARVFERFYRVDEARSRDLGGTGLGLSIVKHLAQSFGGEVAVANVPEGGAAFTVTLPAG